ncbi:MAG: BatA and WFA domain-containing protein, partial [Planctomycetota bacterium]|nr:BatA and WFA domain-containing protein [Planctomycetota bacterium]
MDFLAGTMLWGAAAAAIPVLLHLTGRAKPILHKFPAMRFLLKSQRSSSRALRLKHLLLLLLRVLALALLALALARPIWPLAAPEASALQGKVRGDFVLVLDASMSMQFKEQDLARFELARRQALRFLERLAPESRLALILATEDADAAQGRLTLNHDLVREMLEKAQPTGRGLDLARALAAARSIFEREGPALAQRGVILFTDLQKNAYLALQARGAGAEDGTPPLAVVDVGSADAVNGAVLSARIPGPTVAADQPLTLTGRIRPVDRNRSLPVDLYIDGVKVDQKALEPKGAEVVEVQFTFPAGKPGAHSGVLKIPHNDGLMLDQERALAYVAGRPPKVLVVEQHRPADAPAGYRSSAFFLRAALESPSSISATGLAATVVPPEEVHAGTLAQHQVVVLADPGDIGELTWSALQKFVDEGGGLFVWIGPRTDPALLRRYAYSEFQPHHGLLPGRIQSPVTLESGKTSAVTLALPEHPIFARFTPGVRSALQSVQVRSYVKVEHDPGSSVVLSLGAGEPLLLEKTYGRGRVLLSTVAPDPSGSDLPKVGEVFVTLVLESCRLLAGRGEEAEARLGRPLTLSIPNPPASGTVTWKAPGDAPAVQLPIELPPAAEKPGPKLPAPDAADAESEIKPGVLALAKLNEPGLHRISWKEGRGGAEQSLLIAANPEANESDLAKASPEEALKALAPWKAEITHDVDGVSVVAEEAKPGRELPVLLLLA